MVSVNILTCFVAALWMPIIHFFLLKGIVQTKRLLIGNVADILIVWIAALLLTNEISFVISCLLMAIVFLSVFKCKKIYLLYIPFSYIIVVACNYIVEVIAFKNDYIKEYHETKIWLDILLMFIITFANFIVAFVISVIKNKLANTYELAKCKELIFLVAFNILLCAAAFLINGWATRKSNFTGQIAKTNLMIFGGYMFLTMVISVVTFCIYSERQKMRNEQMQYNSLKEYTSQIEAMYKSVRAFKHDYVNILTSISGYLEAKDYDKLEVYFNDSVFKESGRLLRDNFKLNQLSNIKDMGFKGLASSKLIYAHEMGIDVEIDILHEIDNFYINIFDLNRIMGIYFDNAIEAAMACKQRKEIKFNIIKEAKSVVVILKNTFNQENIALGRLNEYGYSTKGEGRGLGLYNVKEILKKYRNVSKSTSISEGYFEQTLILQK